LVGAAGFVVRPPRRESAARHEADTGALESRSLPPSYERAGLFGRLNAVMLLLTFIVAITIVLMAVILSAGEDQQQRERRQQRDLDMKR
jgi:hypothetical protein